MSERYRVLIVSSIFPPRIGGPAGQAAIFARELANLGVEVRVLTYGPPEDAPGIHVEYLEHSGGRGVLAAARRHLSIARQISRLFAEFAPNAVQMQTAGGLLPLTVGIVARMRGIPSWVKFAGDPVLETLSRQQFREPDKAPQLHSRIRASVVRLVAKLVFRTHRFIWVTTPAIAAQLGPRWGISRDRIVIEPNLVDLRNLKARAQPRAERDPATPLRLLIVTRLDPIKGVDVAIRALALMTDKSAVLRVVGEGQGPHVEQLRSLAEELGVSDRIEWAGPIAREKLGDEYGTADLLLVPSRFETFGIVIVEALATGLPVISSNVGGIADVVQNGRYARLVEPDDAPALAQAIEELAENPGEMARLSLEGQRRADEFDARAGVERWLAIYRASTSAADAPMIQRGAVED